MPQKRRRENTALQQARLARKWSQRRLAEEVGAQTQTVKSWERGTRFPGPDFRERLCHLFGMSLEQLGISEAQSAEQELVVSMAEGPAHMPTGNEEDGQDQNRRRMLRRVGSIWADGVLKNSLYYATLIILGLQEQPDAVANPWRLEVQEANLPPSPLPPGTRIARVYDDAEGELLILGEPGAGKTTLLLELARDLLERASQDPTYPIPVVFNLSSWAQKREPLAVWLVEELRTKYWVPVKQGQQWISNNMLLLLLDGLDEVDEAFRPACVRAINTYKQQQHKFAPLVVCCRRGDYESADTQITLQKAVLVQPLAREQIEAYLACTGKRLRSLREALKRDVDLSDLVQTPLMLSIVALAYQDSDVTPVATQTLEERKSHLFDLYIERMLSRRGQKGHYTQEQIKHWLGRLARQMQRHNQSEFYLERLHPDILQEEQRRRYYTSLAWLLNGISNIIFLLLFGWLRGGKTLTGDGLGTGLLGKLGAPSGNAILQWMAQGVGGGLGGGAAVGLIVVLIAVISGRLITTASYDGDGMSWSWPEVRQGLIRGLRQGLGIGVAVSVPGVLLFSLLQGPTVGWPVGITFGLFSGLVVGLLELVADARPKGAGLSRGLLAHLLDALVIGGCAWAGFYVGNGLLVRSVQAPSYATIIGIFGGVFFLFDKRRSGEGRGFGSWMRPIEIINWSWSNLKRGLRAHLQRGALLGLIVCLWVSLVFGLASAFFHGLTYGLTYGFIYGLACAGGVGGTVTLIMILNSGWTGNLLEEEHFRKPNEGIHRSLRHALLASLLLGLIAGIGSIITSGLAFGLFGGLSGWPILALGLGIVCTLYLMYLFWVVYGGGACMAHLILRLAIWRQGDLPLNLVPFLEYAAERILLRKVGGGYMFVHRLLLEHFAAFPTNTHPANHPEVSAGDLKREKKA